MGNLLSKFNVVSIVSGILISLLLTLILKSIIGDAALWLLPLFTGLISVFLANETELVPLVLTSLVAGLITFIWTGPLFIILALTGGCLGAVVNGYLNQGKLDLSRSTGDNSRVKSIENWITHPQTNKLIPLIITILLAIVLIWGVGLPGSEPTTSETVQNLTNNTTQPSPEQILENNVKKGVEAFFQNFNSLFGQDGVNNGYIISTISLVNLTSVSPTQVNVTVNLEQIAVTGEKFNSTWRGPFFLENGTWVEKGDFVQVSSYTQNP